MIWLRSFSLVPVLLFSPFTNAWHIDEDCQGQTREFVETAVKYAFSLNTYAQLNLRSLAPEKSQLTGFLFGTDEGTRRRLGGMYP